MAVSFVAAQRGTRGNSASWTAILPTGWAAGDVCYIIVGVEANNSPTAPGWTTMWALVEQEVGIGGFSVLRRVLQTGDTNPTVTQTSTLGDAWCTVAFRNASQSTPEDASANSPALGDHPTIVAPDITATKAGDYLLSIFKNYQWFTGTPPGGQTEVEDQDGLQVNVEARAASGTTGTRTETLTATGLHTCAGSILVQPALTTFQPPTDPVVSPIYLSEPDPYAPVPSISTRLFRHYQPRAAGRNVFKLVDGTYTETQPYPNIDASTQPGQIGATTVAITYYGGHIYQVTPAEAAALTAAGYGAYLT